MRKNMITILETNKPIFKNQCSHKKEEYQFTIIETKQRGDDSVSKKHYDAY